MNAHQLDCIMGAMGASSAAVRALDFRLSGRGFDSISWVRRSTQPSIPLG